MPISLPGAATAQLLETWLDPPLQCYFRPTTINWHAAIVDPVSKLPQIAPVGGGVTFEWVNPPVQNAPQLVSPTLLGDGLYVVSLPLTMIGKVRLSVTLFDGDGDILDSNTTVIVVYPTGL